MRTLLVVDGDTVQDDEAVLGKRAERLALEALIP
jgi:hypothetical protein